MHLPAVGCDRQVLNESSLYLNQRYPVKGGQSIGYADNLIQQQCNTSLRTKEAKACAAAAIFVMVGYVKFN